MQKNTSQRFILNDDPFEIVASEKDRVIIQRHIMKSTHRDLEIQNLSIPRKPMWLNLIVRLIRFYQKWLSPRLGNRCVFDPSCSRYSEVAFRERGFTQGFKLTLRRLKRCRPENGGIDILN